MRDVELFEIERALVLGEKKGSLARFVRMAFPHVKGETYMHGWHIDVMCEYLEAVSAGEIFKLVVNQPPRTMKSMILCVFWPLWEWIWNPRITWAFASYDATLTARDGRKMLKILTSKWWQRRFDPRVTEARPPVTDFANTDGGSRFATSIAGKFTGRHVHRLVIDDPLKPYDASGGGSVTKQALANCIVWLKQTASTRRVDPATFVQVIMMQRLHEQDLAGEALAEGGWTHLCLPMRYEPKIVCVCNNIDCTPEDPRRVDDELLWPELFPKEVVDEDFAINLGEAAAAAQYQQRPTPAKGGLFKRKQYRYWHPTPGHATPLDPAYPCQDHACVALPDADDVEATWVMSWDMTFKGEDNSDFVNGQVWCHWRAKFFLVDMVNERYTFTESVAAVRDLKARYPQCGVILVEDKANGTAVVDVLTDEIPGMLLVDPRGGKITRAYATTPFWEGGNVYVPHPDVRPWVGSYRQQHSVFPKGVNDDMVDTTTQALIYFREGKSNTIEALRAIRNERLAREAKKAASQKSRLMIGERTS